MYGSHLYIIHSDLDRCILKFYLSLIYPTLNFLVTVLFSREKTLFLMFFMFLFATIFFLDASHWYPDSNRPGNCFIVLINKKKLIEGVFLEIDNHRNYILLKVNLRTKSNYSKRYKAQKRRRWRGGLER